MRTPLTFAALSPFFVLFAACARKQDDTPPPTVATAPSAYQSYPPPVYAPPQPGYAQPGYAQPQPYPNQYPAPAPTYAQPGPPMTAPAPVPTYPAAPAGSMQMAVPGPIAFQCQNDVPCGTHHCNMQYGKCAFPCQSAADCISPNQCLAGLCIPAPPH
jgi:hypothetical protein